MRKTFALNKAEPVKVWEIEHISLKSSITKLLRVIWTKIPVYRLFIHIYVPCVRVNVTKCPELASSSLRPGFEGCSEIMNDPLYLRFVCLEQDEIFPEY